MLLKCNQMCHLWTFLSQSLHLFLTRKCFYKYNYFYNLTLNLFECYCVTFVIRGTALHMPLYLVWHQRLTHKRKVSVFWSWFLSPHSSPMAPMPPRLQLLLNTELIVTTLAHCSALILGSHQPNQKLLFYMQIGNFFFHISYTHHLTLISAEFHQMVCHPTTQYFNALICSSISFLYK